MNAAAGMSTRALRQIARWLGKRPSERVVVLVYHRVAKPLSDPWYLAVTPEHFAEHLEALRQHAVPLRLQHLSRALAKGATLPGRSVVVTFDDGYADNLHNAKPLLERYGIPATIFLTSGFIGSEDGFWWDELDRLLLRPGRLPKNLRLNINGKTRRWQLGDAARYPRAEFRRHRRWRAWEDAPTPRHALYRSLWGQLHRSTDEEQRKVISELRGWAGPVKDRRPGHRLLSLEQATDLANDNLIEIGAHTVNHPSLSSLPLKSQRHEIVESKARLEDLVGSPVTSFAYPYGKRSDYSARTVALLQQSGFTCACSNFPGFVSRSTDAFQIPRIQAEDWDGDEFARQLKEWFDG
jgi:peptidoglycan/xylan/chitin deacetylase (PgdA/CDA1 family)